VRGACTRDQVAPHCPTNLYGAHGAPIPEEVAAVTVGLGRIIALYYRSSTSYHIHYIRRLYI
jgi:hypothetical protein